MTSHRCHWPIKVSSNGMVGIVARLRGDKKLRRRRSLDTGFHGRASRRERSAPREDPTSLSEESRAWNFLLATIGIDHELGSGSVNRVVSELRGGKLDHLIKLHDVQPSSPVGILR